jgi:hypothetical protein
MPAYYPENNTPLREDYTERSLQKINALMNASSPEWDDLDLSYDGNGNLTQVVYKLNGSAFQTLNFTYSGSDLIRVQKS